MSYLATQRFTALLALLAGAGAILMTGLRFARLPGVRAIVAPVRQSQLWLAWVVAATSTAGSLYFSEHFELIPCRLCWFQRIAMFPLALILLVAALRNDRSVRWYAVPLAAIGAATSFWHQLVEWNPQLESSSCSAVACSVPYFRAFGFVSLSFMALCGFAAIIALLTLASPSDTTPTDTPPPDSTTNRPEEHFHGTPHTI